MQRLKHPTPPTASLIPIAQAQLPRDDVAFPCYDHQLIIETRTHMRASLIIIFSGLHPDMSCSQPTRQFDNGFMFEKKTLPLSEVPAIAATDATASALFN